MNRREIDMLPSKTVGRRREAPSTPASANVLLRTVQELRGCGIARRGLYRFESFEEAQEWMRSQMAQRFARRPSTTSVESAAPSRPPKPATS